MSTKGMISSTWDLKNWAMKGAERFIEKVCPKSHVSTRRRYRNPGTHLAVVSSVLSEDLGRLDSVGEEESTEVEELGSVNEGLDGGGLEVGRLEGLGGSEGRAEGPTERCQLLSSHVLER
jgi:hypothetical protein